MPKAPSSKCATSEIYREAKAIAAELVEVTDNFVSISFNGDASISDLCLGAEHAERVAENLRAEVVRWILRIQPRIAYAECSDLVEWVGRRVRERSRN